VSDVELLDDKDLLTLRSLVEAILQLASLCSASHSSPVFLRILDQ
jgi:hypothetical protein